MHSKDFPDSFYRVSIKALCVQDGKVLLSHEAENIGGGWELPGGGLDFGEDIQVGLKREIQEELELEIKTVSKRPIYVWPTLYKNWRGMEWYYAFAAAYRVEFENLNFKPTNDVLEMRFFSKEELMALDCSKNPMTEDFKMVFDPKDFENDF